MDRNNVVEKRLLVLGGTKATYDLVKVANEMGIVTAVTDDDPTHETRKIAKENYLVSTTDIPALKKLISEKNLSLHMWHDLLMIKIDPEHNRIYCPIRYLV